MKRRTWGIILLVLGIMSIFGASVNGTFAEFANGIGISEITTVALMIALIVGGIILIVKNKKE